MKVQELGLDAISEGKLGQLAMAVELHCRQRFSTRKDVMDIAALLIVAETSDSALVMQRRDEFLRALPCPARVLLARMTGDAEVGRQGGMSGLFSRMLGRMARPAQMPVAG